MIDSPNAALDSDLETLRTSLHAIDDMRIHEIQKRRNTREVARLMDHKYSLRRALTAMRRDTVNRDCPFEKSVSDRIAEVVGREPRPGTLFVPVDGRRDLNATVDGEGNFW